MDAFRYLLQLGGMATIVIGPPAVLFVLWKKARRIPTFIWFTLVSVAVCSAAFWLFFISADQLLDYQFRSIVPNGEWTPNDEATWTDREQRIIAAHFGDGGRNVFALYAPVVFLTYSIVLWSLARIINAVFQHRAA